MFKKNKKNKKNKIKLKNKNYVERKSKHFDSILSLIASKPNTMGYDEQERSCISAGQS